MIALPDGSDEDEPAVAAPERFRFKTDAAGLVYGVHGIARGALVGLSIAHSGAQGLARVDGVAAGGFRRRSRFQNARLEVGGRSSVAGSWRLTGAPAFDPETGRFTGFRGTGRRPRSDESAAPVRLGLIHARAADRRAANEDDDEASRLGIEALRLLPRSIALRPVIERVVDDLAPLADLRGVRVLVDGDEGARATAENRGAERVLARLLATLVSSGSAGETIRASVRAGPGSVEIAVDRPRALIGLEPDALLALDGQDGATEDAPAALGAGFALRVTRNLATQLGGALEIRPMRLALRLPAEAEHAATF